MRAIDGSNYTDGFTPDNLRVLQRDYDVGLALLQAVEPRATWVPRTKYLDQIRVCAEVGMPYDTYVYGYLADPEWCQAQAALIAAAVAAGLPPTREVWYDSEDVETGLDWTPDERIDAILRDLAYLDSVGAGLHVEQVTGYYGAKWYVDGYLGGSQRVLPFAWRELWDADYDQIDDPNQVQSSWVPYGGFTRRSIKQYAGTSVLGGVSGIDLDVLDPEEANEVSDPTPAPEPPAPDPCQPIIDTRNSLIGAVAYLGDDQGDKLATVLTGRWTLAKKREVQAVVAELRRVRLEQVGPRP